VKAISVTGGVTKISATRLKKGDVYQQALKSGAKSLPYLKVLEGGERSSRPPVSPVSISLLQQTPPPMSLFCTQNT
jgi:hypothetical protein